MDLSASKASLKDIVLCLGVLLIRRPLDVQVGGGAAVYKIPHAAYSWPVGRPDLTCIKDIFDQPGAMRRLLRKVRSEGLFGQLLEAVVTPLSPPAIG